MKNFDLDAYGVVEMTQQELLEVNGGGGFWQAIGDALTSAAQWVAGVVRDALCALLCPCPR